MSPSESQDLVEFLTGRFFRIDQCFETVDQQLRALRGGLPSHFSEVYRRLERRLGI